jgi:glycosyltransferase involved in cell wall biosynthesis
LEQESIPYVVNSMSWPEIRRPWRALPAARLARWARRHRIDVIQCNEQQSYPFAAAVARLSGLPIVCHVRCKLDAGFTDWIFRRRPPDALIWCTRQMAAEGAAAVEATVPEGRQHVIPLGVDGAALQWAAGTREATRAAWGVGEEGLVVGMSCFIRPGKRVEEFLALARRLNASNNVTFVLAGGPAAGDEPYFESVRPILEQSDKDRLVRWVGHVEPVERFLHAVDVFVSTSEHESFGMSVCEAMACGKPVAAYAACSVQEVISDAGLVVETGNFEALAASLERLIANARLRQELGEKAERRVASCFHPAKSLVQLTDIYRRLRRHKPEVIAQRV